MRIATTLLLITALAGCNLLGGGEDGPSPSIVFAASDGEGRYQIYSMREDGSGVRRLTNGEYSSTAPAWSPDGQQIAFMSNRDYFDADTLRFRTDLYVVNTNGSRLHRITETGFALDPVWNPNGNTKGFRSSSSSLGLFQVDVKSGEIFEIKVDIPAVNQSFPMAWSSDGQKLLVTARDQSRPHDFFIYLVDTGNGQSELIPFEPVLMIGADWLTSFDNQN